MVDVSRHNFGESFPKTPSPILFYFVFYDDYGKVCAFFCSVHNQGTITLSNEPGFFNTEISLNFKICFLL